MGLKFKEDLEGPFSDLKGIEEISREEIHHPGGAVSVEFKFKGIDGQERYFFYNCMNNEDIPKTLNEALTGMSKPLPVLPWSGGVC